MISSDNLYAYFLFRLKQQFRFLAADRGSYFLLIPFLIIIGIYLGQLLINLGVVFTQFLLALCFITLASKRKDIAFIKYVFKTVAFQVVLIEYLCLLLLFQLFSLLLFGFDSSMLFICILPLLVSLIQVNLVFTENKTNVVRKITSLIPLYAYEWRSGVRRNELLFIGSYILGLFCVLHFPITSFLLVYWSTFAGDFFIYIEVREVIQSYSSYQNFKNRMLRLLFVGNMLFLPHYILFILFYSWLSILFLGIAIIFFNMIFLFSLLLKYTRGKEGGRIQNTLPISVYAASLLCLPISIYLIYNVWKKSKKQLGLLLN